MRRRQLLGSLMMLPLPLQETCDPNTRNKPDEESVGPSSQRAVKAKGGNSGKAEGTGETVSLKERVIGIISEQLPEARSELTADAWVMEPKNLGATSLDLIELTMAFEEAFQIEIPDEDVVDLGRYGGTVGAWIDYLAARLDSDDPAESAASEELSSSQIVTDLARRSKVDREVVERVLTHLVEFAAVEVRRGNEFTIPGLGHLVKRIRPARVGRNPATGAPIEIPEKKSVKFLVAKSFSDSILSRR